MTENFNELLLGINLFLFLILVYAIYKTKGFVSLYIKYVDISSRIIGKMRKKDASKNTE